MRPRPLRALSLTLLTCFVLACSCGLGDAGPISGSDDGDEGDEELLPDVQADSAAPAAPASTRASSRKSRRSSGSRAAASADGAYPGTARGVCEMWTACGCLTDPMSDCLSTLNGPGFDSEVLGCIAANGCGACEDAVTKGCIDSVYGERSRASRQSHETTMGIIENYPTGGPCPSGTRPVRDGGGNVIGCR